MSLTLDQVRNLKAEIEAVWDEIESFESNSNARQKGATIYFKWKKPVSCVDVTVPFVGLVSSSPSMVLALLEQLESLMAQAEGGRGMSPEQAPLYRAVPISEETNG